MALKAEDRVTKAELDRRRAEVAGGVRERGLDALLVSGINFAATLGYLRYLTNWAQPFVGEYYLLRASGEGIFLARTRERAALVRKISGLEARAGATPKAVAEELRAAGAKRVGICSLGTMTAQFHQGLLQQAGPIEFLDAAEILDRVRMVKSPEEIEWVRRSAELGDLAFSRFREAAAPGAGEHEVFAELDALVRRSGAEDTYFMMDTGTAPVPKFLDMAAATYRPGDVVLFNAEIAGPGGYYTQVVRSGTAGKAGQEVSAVYAVCREALEAGERALKPGTPVNQVFRAADGVIRSSKYKRGLHIGHAQGLDIYEKPLVEEGDGTVLTPGMVMVLHPHVELPGGGGVWAGETFLITAEGSVRLHRSGRELFEL